MICHIDSFDEYVQEMHWIKYLIVFVVKALFIAFSREKNTFQWPKVVSEAIFPTISDSGLFLTIGLGTPVPETKI